MAEFGKHKIMYVCAMCEDATPESCGHLDPLDLRVAHDGTWLCDGCWEEYDAPPYGIRSPFHMAPKLPVYQPQK